MSLIHWDKSVLSFHFKEILEDHQAGDRSALLGLGAILFGTIVVPATTRFGRPILKQIIKTGLSVYEESQNVNHSSLNNHNNFTNNSSQKEVVNMTEVESYNQ